MRYLDELLALYTGKDPFTRKFILAQLLDQPPDSFSDQVVELLWGESRDADAVVRRQARYSLGQILPAHAAFSYGLSSGAPAASLAQDDGAGEAPPPGGLSAEGRLLSAGAARSLPGVLERVLGLLDRGSPVERVAASLVLGRIHSAEVLGMLIGATKGPDLSYMAAFSLAETGEEAAVEALVAAADEHGRSRPDLYMVLRGLPCAATRECLERQEELADPAGRANIALALAHFASAESRPLLERLVRRREGWVSAYVLDTLSGHGDPEDLPLIRLGYELEGHEFIRTQAVRAAGGIRSDAAREFCMEVLASGVPRIQSAALEALAAQELPAEELARLAEPFLASDITRVRVQAMLAMSQHDPDRAAESLTQIILAPEALLRLEGAYVTGHLRPPGGLSLLERMAASDPSISVRTQAVKSIARYTAGEALPVLVRLLEVQQRPLLLAIFRALAGLERPGAVAVALADNSSRVNNASARAALLRTLGITTRLAERPAPALLVDALDDADVIVKVGALEGLKYLGDEIPPERVRPLLAHADPRVRARAAAVMFLAGQPGEAGALEPMLSSGDETQTLEALSALLELGAVVPQIGRGGFTRLREALFSAQSAPAPAPVRRPSKTRPVPSLRKADLLASLSGTGSQAARAASKDMGKLAGEYQEKNKILGMKDDSASTMRLPSVAVPAPMRAPDGPARPEPVTRVPGIKAAQSDQKSRALRPAGVESGTRPEGDPVGARRAALVAGAVGLAMLGAIASKMGGEGEGSASEPGRTAPSAVVAQRTAIRVWSVTGACGRTDADGKPAPLVVGSYLKPGDRLITEAGGKVQVRFQDGSAVHLGPASQVTAAGATERSDKGALPAVKVEDPVGEIVLESKVTELHIKLGTSHYRTIGGRAKILSAGTGWKIEQVEGDGTLVKGTDRQVLVAGQGAGVGL